MMNLYLATCHVLSLLEEPLSPADFQAQVQPQNPLFATACTTPQKFLQMLAEEKILQEKKTGFVLSELGKILQNHVLQWTARDKQESEKRKKNYQTRKGLQPIAPDCPRCKQRFCALYVFIVLLERLYEGLENWNLWQNGEAEILSTALHHACGELPAPHYLLSETCTLQNLSPLEQQGLQSTLASAPELTEEQELIADFRNKAQNSCLLPELKSLKQNIERVSRLRLDYGLMPPENLLILNALRTPEWDPREIYPAEKHAEISGSFLQISRPGISPAGNKALLYLSQGQDKRLFLLRHSRKHWQVLDEISWEN
ncbi:hypothetical protein COW36_07230 [bacterium (Candidatus Blackallbacteria) CG17_big_fil_post_rev_8_21_14_2_50_48_46]|uniref:Uncharacterized protein n=1 Tax=bacterium (Candidatus Blackallbacteria) CG17_big_fil_post_rev_8_21_14_2_50_48_46 TaxID=2014261 RepID=A0A2M7G7X1_9BACT|nr:MAG: hypothetical protein COW64_06740 [bacterium (Candidatus Blackallbacteria) CG18_big_fil_WC_8_21_14_2_50_49_26]PIW17854.1 MAG: hypothetical protein COW36_07230 [bacterium (Candidatus Blackallbacteria) CG17_big_fil_post_rev_8_21_14_2_50_48_46]PIW48530.1 MAG: hypothetical protein COW20_09185 [bacterium (Candidatus Blackallbacteria) CG13_big_fil_rev_8_21_14_2_50_49_14]